MLPKYLKLSAFGPYSKELEVDFTKFTDSGLFLITGPTGSGKTMIFDAIMFALYGKTSGQVRETDTLRCDHSDVNTPTFVEFTFILHQKQFHIRRTPKYFIEGKKSPKQPTALLTLPDGKMVEGVKDVNSKVAELLGVDEKQFKQIAMIAQGEFTKLIMASSEDREKVLREIFHTHRYQMLEQQIKDKLTDYKNEYETYVNRKKQLLEELNINGDYQEYIKQLKQNYNDNKVQYDALEKEKNNNQSELQARKLKNDQILQLQSLKEKQTVLLNQKEYYNNLSNHINVLKQVKDTNYIDKSYKDQVNKTINIQNKLSNLSIQIQQATEEFNNVEKEYANKAFYQQQKDQAMLNIQKSRTLLNQLRNNEYYYQEKQKLLHDHHMLEEELNRIQSSKKKKEISVEQITEKINSEGRLMFEFGNIKQEYDQATQQKAQIHELSSHYDNLGKQQNKYMDLQESYKKCEKAFYDGRAIYDEYEKKYFRKQAGVIAATLKDNEPCPICGSIHHPCPAQLNEDDISEEMLSKQKNNVDKLYQAFNEAYQNLLLKQQEIQTIVNQINNAKDKHNIQEELSKQYFVRVLSQIETSMAEFKNKYTYYDEQLNYIKKLKTTISYEKQDLENLTRQEERCRSNLNNVLMNLSTIDGKIDPSLQGYKIEEVENYITIYTNNVTQYDQKIVSLDNLYKQSNDKRVSLHSSFQALQEQFNIEKQKEVNLKEELEKDIQKYSQDYRVLIQQLPQLQEYEKQYQDYILSLNLNEQQIQSLNAIVGDSMLVEVDTLQQQIDNQILGLENIKQVLDQIILEINIKESTMKKIKDIDKHLAGHEKDYQNYNTLYNLTSGKNGQRVSLERFVLATYFEQMLLYANEVMDQLSQGRYKLLRRDNVRKGRSQQGLELDVLDHESGVSRDIRSLSGGELFKAAISLALGLSKMIQDYAGGIELNALFIDEGFGSLDGQSLDQAMNTLLELQEDNKLIGIISHVSELKERIDSQIVVTRKSKESIVTIKQ